MILIEDSFALSLAKDAAIKTIQLLRILVFLVLTVQAALAHAEGDAMSSQLKKLLANHKGKLSFSLRDPEGREVVNVDGDKALAPASIAKTVSTYCSLQELGPQFQFDTYFGFTGHVLGDTLNGDLVIRGSGDPSFVIEDLHEVIEKLRYVVGIRQITGGLVLDNSFLGQKSLQIASGFEGDEGRSFSADLTPFIINQNSFSLWVSKDFSKEGRTRVASLPANVLDLQISNDSKMGSATEISVSYDPNELRARVSGSLARDGEAKGTYRAVDDPYAYNLKMLHRLWLDSGGEWKSNEMKTSNSLVAVTPVWHYTSRPLAKILMDVNKFSLNLGAEMIFLAAGADKFGLPANYEKSLHLFKDCLTEMKLEPESFKMTNGSGLSREALLKSSALSQFLFFASRGSFAPEYLSSFGILGLDGTSKSRLKSYKARARLKTGSLKDVRSVAGYLYSKDHRTYSFAMIQNSVNGQDAKQLEDRVLETFFKNY